MDTNKIIRISYLVKGDQGHVYRASLPPIYQYDRGVQIKIDDIPHEDGLTYRLDAANEGDETAIILEEIGPDLWQLDDDLIKNGRNIELYLFVKGAGWGRTIRIWDIFVTDRPKADRTPGA